ncbi:TTAGGG repeat binding factor [Coemansia sp. RSA 1285]|nr:TTAGGG repeat binding factor [Coemansia sp. RSA 1285]
MFVPVEREPEVVFFQREGAEGCEDVTTEPEAASALSNGNGVKEVLEPSEGAKESKKASSNGGNGLGSVEEGVKEESDNGSSAISSVASSIAGSSSTSSEDGDKSSSSGSEHSEPAQQSKETDNSANLTLPETNGSAISIIARLNATEPLLDRGQMAQIGVYEQHIQDDEGRRSSQPLGSRGTAADLAVLDYMSDRILSEIGAADLLIKSSFAIGLAGAGRLETESADEADAAMQRLDCLAREHVLYRRNHFTGDMFLENKHRPDDEPSIERWFTSLDRINVATFALLVFRPQTVITETTAHIMPNHERMVASLGLKAAVKAFFEHIVPLNRRNADTLSLLVDMQTQVWLLSATDEATLQEIIEHERSTSNDPIEMLLAIYPRADGMDENSQSFDAQGVAMYRSEVNQRLSKISGGKLNITRSQYPLSRLWISLAEYCVAKVVESAPCTIAKSVAEKELDGDDFELDIAGDAAAARNDELGEIEHTKDYSGEFGESPMRGDFEVTIFKTPREKRPAVPTTTTTKSSSAAVEPVAAPEANGLEVNESDNEDITIDLSFLEERRVAVLLRDALSDIHLDELMSKIDAEIIDVSKPSTRTRMSERPQLALPVQMEKLPETIDDNEEFRLQIDESGGDREEDHSDDEQRIGRLRSSDSTPMRTRLRAKRRRVSLGRENGGFEGSGDEQADIESPEVGAAGENGHYGRNGSADDEMLQRILNGSKGTPKSKGVRYHPLRLESSDGNEFQGRRGISAEDISDLIQSHVPVQFTQSADELSEPEDSGDDRAAAAADGRRRRRLASASSTSERDTRGRLGQYRPIRPAPARHEETDDEYFSGGHRLVNGRMPQRSRRSTAQHRIRWTPEEEECFVRAIHKYGNAWKEILRDHGPRGIVDHVLAKRNSVNLKDKARNIKIRLMREGKPLGPFYHATGHL